MINFVLALATAVLTLMHCESYFMNKLFSSESFQRGNIDVKIAIINNTYWRGK